MKKHTITRREIVEIIRAGGATLAADGSAVHYGGGYQVSRRDCYAIDARRIGAVLRAVRRVMRALAPGESCGVWIDENGRACVDVSEHVARLSVAMRLGIARGQSAIYDWAFNRSISCAVEA